MLITLKLSLLSDVYADVIHASILFERDVSLESIPLLTGDIICDVSRIERLSIKSAGVTPVDVFSTVFMMR
jgi:hypothetical protein